MRRSPPHRGVDRNAQLRREGGNGAIVAPSQGRGSKRVRRLPPGPAVEGRPLTGAWIETPHRPLRTLRSAGRPLTGAWIETRSRTGRRFSTWSPPHRGVDRNVFAGATVSAIKRRPLTGAWIETSAISAASTPPRVAPSQGRGSKRRQRVFGGRPDVSPPHRGVDRNAAGSRSGDEAVRSPPHRGVDRNDRALAARRDGLVAPSQGRGSKHKAQGSQWDNVVGRPLTGAWIETPNISTKLYPRSWSPPHRGVDRNMPAMGSILRLALVAPSQGRGSKHFRRHGRPLRREVAPSQGRGSKRGARACLFQPLLPWSCPHRPCPWQDGGVRRRDGVRLRFITIDWTSLRRQACVLSPAWNASGQERADGTQAQWIGGQGR